MELLYIQREKGLLNKHKHKEEWKLLFFYYFVKNMT